jgi:hypothetical protein
MSGSLLIGLAQRASWIVLHSSGSQVARREFFFSCRAVHSKKTTFGSPSTVCRVGKEHMCLGTGSSMLMSQCIIYLLSISKIILSFSSGLNIGDQCNTIRNNVIRCVLSETVHLESMLNHLLAAVQHLNHC